MLSGAPVICQLLTQAKTLPSTPYIKFSPGDHVLRLLRNWKNLYIEICDKKCQNSISKKKNNLRHVKYFGVPEIIDNFIFYWNASSSPSPRLRFYGWGWSATCLVYYNENSWKYAEEISIFSYQNFLLFKKQKQKKSPNCNKD